MTTYRVLVMAPMVIVVNAADARSASIIAERATTSICETFAKPDNNKAWIEVIYGPDDGVSKVESVTEMVPA